MRALAAALAVALSACAVAPDVADTTVFTGRFITMEPDRPRAGAVAVRGGRIVAVAETPDGLAGKRVALPGTLMPGLIDPHLHPVLAAVLLPMEFITPEDWELSSGRVEGVKSREAYLSRLEAFAATSGDGPLYTWGHHPLFHGQLTRADLDRVSPDRPLHVWHRSFHEMVLNTAAMERLGIGTDDAFATAMDGTVPDHADFEEGIVHETALAALLPRLAPDILAPDHLADGFAELRAMLESGGVTFISDMGTGTVVDFLTEAGLIARGLLDEPAAYRLVPVVGQEMARAGGLDAGLDAAQTHLANHPSDNRVKLFADGAFFAQYMQMREPYLDGHDGKWLTPPDLLRAQAKAAWARGLSLHIHVNGDAGLDAVLDTVEALPPREGQRVVLEHLGYHAPDQTARMAALSKSHGLAVSAQPNYVHVVADAYAEEGLGRTRAHAISRLAPIAEAGVPVALHSDLTMAPSDPLRLAWIAGTRTTLDGDAVGDDLRLSLQEALEGVTVDAAYVLGLEDEIGSLAVGKRADFTVLAQDPYAVGVDGLDAIAVLERVIGGERVDAPD